MRPPDVTATGIMLHLTRVDTQVKLDIQQWRQPKLAEAFESTGLRDKFVLDLLA